METCVSPRLFHDRVAFVTGFGAMAERSKEK